MTTRNMPQANGRSPALQQLLDEVVDTPVMPVRRVPPVPEPRRESAGALFRLTGHRARPHRRRGVTGPHAGQHPGARRLSAGTPRVLAFRVHRALDQGEVPLSTGLRPPAAFRPTTAPRPTTAVSRSVAFRRSSAFRAIAARPRDQARSRVTEMRSRRARILRGLVSRPVAVAATSTATSRLAPVSFTPLSVAIGNLVEPVDVRDVGAPNAREVLGPPGSSEIFASTNGAGAGYQHEVATDLAPPDGERAVTDPGKRRQLHRRAVLLSGGVAAAVVAIVAVIVFVVGQGSLTSPAADRRNTSPSTSVGDAGTPPAAAVVATTAEPVSPTVTSAGPTTAVRSPATLAAPRTAALAPPATNRDSQTATPTPTATPAPVVGVDDTATVVTGISKLTGWVPISTPNP